MALRTGSARVHRVVVVLFIDKQADSLPTGACRRQLGLRVAGQAVLVGQSVRIENVADLVRRVAVDTGRNLAWIFGPQLAFDDLAVHLFDLSVASRTGRSNIVCVDARSWIGVRTNVMGRMAGGADGRDSETLSEQTLTVNAHRIMLEDVLLRYLVTSGYGRSLSVATSTEQRHVHHGRRRVVIRGRQDIVLAMTVGTDRSHWITVFCGDTMQTTLVRIGLWPVAATAVDKLQVLACRVPALGRIQIAVAVDARHVGVNGCCVILFVHEDRYVLARKGAR